MSPADCDHPVQELTERGNAHARWITCKACGQRWERVQATTPFKAPPGQIVRLDSQPTRPPMKALPAKASQQKSPAVAKMESVPEQSVPKVQGVVRAAPAPDGSSPNAMDTEWHQIATPRVNTQDQILAALDSQYQMFLDTRQLNHVQILEELARQTWSQTEWEWLVAWVNHRGFTIPTPPPRSQWGFEEAPQPQEPN